MKAEEQASDVKQVLYEKRRRFIMSNGRLGAGEEGRAAAEQAKERKGKPLTTKELEKIFDRVAKQTFGLKKGPSAPMLVKRVSSEEATHFGGAFSSVEGDDSSPEAIGNEVVEEGAASNLQAAHRGKKERKEKAKQVEAATKIQSAHRGKGKGKKGKGKGKAGK